MGNALSRGGYITLRGHAQTAAVCFLPTGELVTAGDTTMRLWNCETWKSEKTWRFSNSVETCCCSPDGTYIACGVVDGLIFVFDVKTRQQAAVWQAHAECRQGPLLQFFADGMYLLSAAVYTCKIWSARTSKLINTWDTSLITSICITADCTVLAVGSPSGIVTTHSLPEGVGTHQLHAHRSEVWAIAFSPDGQLMATASREEPDGLRLWRTDGWQLVQNLRGHVGCVLSAGFSANGLRLVSSGFDKTLRIWAPVADGAAAAAAGPPLEWRCENILAGHGDAVLASAFAPGGAAVVASGSRDGMSRAWRLKDVPFFTVADAQQYNVPPLL